MRQFVIAAWLTVQQIPQQTVTFSIPTLSFPLFCHSSSVLFAAVLQGILCLSIWDGERRGDHWCCRDGISILKSHCLATTLDKSGAYLCREPALLHHQHKTVWGELGIQFQEEEAGTSICLWGGSHTHEPQGSIAITPLESKRFKVCSTLSFAWMFCFQSILKETKTLLVTLFPSDGDWQLSHNL